MKLGSIAGMAIEIEDEAIEKIIKVAVRELAAITLELYSSEEFVERLTEVSTKISEKIFNDMIEEDKTPSTIS